MRPRVWFFDLDDTLHFASHAIVKAIDARMTAYVEQHLNVDRTRADFLRRDYWQRYGATLLGLVRHHAVDPHHFLRETHDFDVAALLRAERGLVQVFKRLPGRKVLLTNAPAAYADRVVSQLGLAPHFARRYAIEAMRVHGRLRPKPSKSMLRRMLSRERVRAGAAVLVEDNLGNLKAARAAGLRTVLVQTHRRTVVARPHRRPDYVNLRVESVRDLPRRLSTLRR
jgi:putative hydrolase of the HAD superfamily